MNLFDYAIKTELQGKACYENLAAQTQVVGLSNIFLGLAAEEDRHIEAFRKLKAGKSYQLAESGLLEQAKGVFAELQANRDKLAELREDLDGYRFAMKVEAESVRHCEEMATGEANPEIVRLYQRIIEEEKRHFNIMENVFEFVLRPRYTLEWREFSNLHEM
ncbi:hypothetical protein GMST_34050 [Geomonas silvestris]|uniref:Rubrerythrin diiron-binding domain-containing protein n=1 Tax=Geomonas silvestris TaxID=2740184 RepID=A0A6V8MM31_9BACT|nr:ferritin family protein [Geomonas silvestris]GFO61080.1 hypothetical protein GMST_34050 [Geomonas silvestris]